MRKVWRRAAVLLAVVVAFTLVPNALGNAAAPYITKPGAKERFLGDHAVITAHIWCGSWQAIVQFTVGTRGSQVYRKTIYVCESKDSANVKFIISAAQLRASGHGHYQYRIKTGRHDKAGRVTKWTDSVAGDFDYS
jgi:hypothetical protein